ncbi:MAG: FAD/NAD(P)-binding protein [Nitrospirota bacterium]
MNQLKPVKAYIKDIKLEAEEVKTYTLFTEYSFVAKPGQFNMVGYPGVGEAPISLSSIVRNGCFEHTIKAVGRVTNFLNNLGKGDEMYFRGPYGRGWPLNEARGGDILLIAGGVGLAPIRPVVQMILNKRDLFNDVSLIYGARSEKNILFTNEFDGWEKGISLYLTVDEVLQHPPQSSLAKEGTIPSLFPLKKGGSKGVLQYHTGLVTDLLDKIKINPGNTVAFICGPEIMMRFICRGLLMMGVASSRIYVSLERRMRCGIAHCGHCQHFGLFVCKDGPVFSYKEVKGLPDGIL